jgi:hypothetical protein
MPFVRAKVPVLLACLVALAGGALAASVACSPPAEKPPLTPDSLDPTLGDVDGGPGEATPSAPDAAPAS